MSKSQESCGTTVAALLLLLPITLYCAWTTGYVGTRIWLWLAVPHGFKAIAPPVFQAGYLLLSIARVKYAKTEEDEADPMTRAAKLVVVWAWPWLALGAAWLLR